MVSRANPCYDVERQFNKLQKTPGFRNFFKHCRGLPEPRHSRELPAAAIPFMIHAQEELEYVGVEVRRLADEEARKITEFVVIPGDKAVVISWDPSSTKPPRAYLLQNPRLVQDRKAEFHRLWLHGIPEKSINEEGVPTSV